MRASMDPHVRRHPFTGIGSQRSDAFEARPPPGARCHPLPTAARAPSAVVVTEGQQA